MRERADDGEHAVETPIPDDMADAVEEAREMLMDAAANADDDLTEKFLEEMTLTEEEIGEYSGQRKEIRPVTISTYQMLTWRRSKTSEFEHFEVFRRENWGLVVYDEVHLLPASIFRPKVDSTFALGCGQTTGSRATLFGGRAVPSAAAAS